MKGNVKLQLYRRRLKAPVAGEAPLPVLILVHGSSMSTMPTFDLTVPGAGEYSMFNVFARYGYDVWGIDFEGYGRSSVTPGWSDIKSGVADLAAMAPIVERETGQRGGYHMIGELSGALRVAAFAAQYPDRVRPPGLQRLHLYRQGFADADRAREEPRILSQRTIAARGRRRCSNRSSPATRPARPIRAPRRRWSPPSFRSAIRSRPAPIST